MALASQARSGLMGAIASAARHIHEIYAFQHKDEARELNPALADLAHDFLVQLHDPAYAANAASAGFFEGNYNVPALQAMLNNLAPELVKLTGPLVLPSPLEAPGSIRQSKSLPIPATPTTGAAAFGSPEGPAPKRQRSGNFIGTPSGSLPSSSQGLPPLPGGLSTPRHGAASAASRINTSDSASTSTSRKDRNKRPR
jgi:hypothetical protein